MYIAGRDTWRITIDEPTVLRLALYVRDVERLPAATDPAIPPLDPGPRTWPVWSHRPRSPAPPMPVGAVDRAAAAEQWTLWWNHLLPRGDAVLGDLRGPAFHALAGLPALQVMVRHHYDTALAWAEGIGDDPRIKRDHLAAGARLTALVEELERDRREPVRPFELMLTVLGVQTKHAWVVSDHQLLLTHHLIADDENAIDWLRRRIGALA
jgi:hypothetical protein